MSHPVWKEILKALSQPQACYAAFTFGLKHHRTYFLRTLPDIQDLLEPLENAISNVLIPAITEHICSSSERDIIALPVRHDSLGITNPCHEANREYQSSVKLNKWVTRRLQCVFSAAGSPKWERRAFENSFDHIKNTVPKKVSRSLDLAGEKAASIWLSTGPMKEIGFNRNKREFRDAIKLCYDWPDDDITHTCVWGEAFSVDHAMICTRGNCNLV